MTAKVKRPLIIKKFINAQGMSPADIQQQINARLYEALRERDRAEGREEFPPNDGHVLSIGIYLDFTDRPGLLVDGVYPGGKSLDRP